MYLNPGNAICVSTRLSQFGKLLSVGVSALERHTILLSGDEEPFGGGVTPVEHGPAEESDAVSPGLKKNPTTRLRRAAIEGDRVVILDIVHCSLLSREKLPLKLKGNFCPKTVA